MTTVNSEQKLRPQHLYSVRPGLTTIQIALKFAASGAVDIHASGVGDGYGNLYHAIDVPRVTGEAKFADAYQNVKGLVWPNEWPREDVLWKTRRQPDHGLPTAPVTRLATGQYKLRFDDRYLVAPGGSTSLRGFKWGIEDASNTKNFKVVVSSWTDEDSADNKSRTSCVVQFVNSANAATDPDADSIVYLEFLVNTSEQG